MPDVAAVQEKSIGTAFDAVLARTGAKDRTHIQRHLTAADAEPEPQHAALWRRLAELLAGVAPLPVTATGHTAVMFFIPDGKYRMQVFALEDQNDGRIALYLPDILADAIKKKILKKGAEPNEYAVVGSLRSTLRAEALDAQNTPEPPVHVKNMLGWNRKSLRVTVPVLGTDKARLGAVDALVHLAAKQWADRLVAAPVAAPAAPAAVTPPPRAAKATGNKKRSA
jgi:hypothetical protein